MEKFIKDYFNQIKIGDDEKVDSFQVFPLFSDIEYEVEYLMMKEALEQELLIIEEVSSSGDVNKLTATNKSDLPILLLGGEELEGAKQNRILNVSILLPPNEKTVIPVNCVEAGRWSYRSKDFKSSENVAYKRMREKSFEEQYEKRSYKIDQSMTWEQVDELEASFSIESPTSAMKDVYDAKSKEISDYMNKISLHDGQIGILAVSKGKILGFDIIGQAKGFENVFKKLLKSYIMEDMLSDEKKKEYLKEDEIRKFFDKVVEASERRIDGVGLGYDYKYNSDYVVGSVLSYKNEVIHSVFLSKSENGKSKNYDDEFFASIRERRRNLSFD